MSTQLGPFEIECDAPPYTVVSACNRLGLQSPEDVRWTRMRHFRQKREALASFFGPGCWAALFGGKEVPAITCSCGGFLPPLEECSFLFADGRTKSYHLGQCARCRTIFWECE